ncbi:MBL fold metallo-hydrolase [Candidatus Peregrinibacteria bacterium]|nr:MBL fold metallo-hydrolase [Candidatus Peregrinibacteria bacterium]
MHIKFLGADREVTGSRHLIHVNGKNILLDCGMFQGKRSQEYARNIGLPFDASEIDAVVLSHAHIDHSGNLPVLVKKGFKGPIYCTFATRDLCTFMLQDSAYIQEREIEYINEKLHRKGQKDNLDAIYTLEDAEHALLSFQSINYNKEFNVTDGVKAIFQDAGHILGSANVTLNIDDKRAGKHITLAFTGDLGRKDLPVLRDPEQIEHADYLISECTYGDRVHEKVKDVEKIVADIVNRTANRGGKIIIPAFALGRTQEVVYAVHRLNNAKRIPEIPIFVDSPLACNVTEVFRNHPECFDKETYDQFIVNHKDPFGFQRLKYVHSVEESKKLNDFKGPCIIIAASGMCEHGRILHHLKNNIETPRNTILIVGFQGQETLGRKIIEKRKVVNIFGKPYRLKAEVGVVNAFSAHGDRNDLLDFAKGIDGLKRVFLVHGEQEQAESFKGLLGKHGIDDVTIPAFGDEIKL